ncbi:protein ALP1-like protein [Cinnamomum micranthum f. kanehirae]|uniref:Protein ALP1-like protein n=1 Tax=Cinnamomum micranthum f. kanehirae TaxID=337451 RepID=A0A3S4NHG9_9MAGN|nr:protein ALP1-like protein [Cinnamomum micranthum f. kanehirae]
MKEARLKKKKAILAVLWAALAAWQMQVAAASAVLFQYQNKADSRKKRTAERAHYLSKLTEGRDEECISQLRLNKESFDYLCDLLRVRGLLKDTHEVTVEEEVAACLHILAYAVKNRTIASRFLRSGETVSRHFHGVLNAILTLAPNFVKQSNIYTSAGPSNFKDCIGAIDGTHIPAFLPVQSQSAYRNRKGTLTQNVLAACGFDLKFQYVLPGWEGSATDARVLQNALTRGDPLVVPPGRYYLMDAGFANAPGFLAPYRGVRYHLKDHRGRTPQDPKELFNKRHSQARNVIERAFGLLKGRFAILRTAPQYDFIHQVSIVHACCTLHNFILEQNYEFDDTEETSAEDAVQNEEGGSEVDLAGVFRPYSQRERDEWHAFRDNFANNLWEEYHMNMTHG